jgi:hypothetical protein
MTAPASEGTPRWTDLEGVMRVARRVGIAIGSIVIAWLALSLVGGVIGLTPASGIIGILAVVVVGGLIYQDIIRHETPPG